MLTPELIFFPNLRLEEKRKEKSIYNLKDLLENGKNQLSIGLWQE